MTAIYEDDQCWYQGGDPRLEEAGEAVVSVNDDAIRIVVRRLVHDHVAFFSSLAKDGVTDEAEAFSRATRAKEDATLEEDTGDLPRQSVLNVRLDRHSMMDLSGFGAEAVSDIELSDEYRDSFRTGVTIQLRDPEGVYPEGFEIALTFRNDYYARVFEKRVREAYDLIG